MTATAAQAAPAADDSGHTASGFGMDTGVVEPSAATFNAGSVSVRRVDTNTKHRTSGCGTATSVDGNTRSEGTRGMVCEIEWESVRDDTSHNKNSCKRRYSATSHAHTHTHTHTHTIGGVTCFLRRDAQHAFGNKASQKRSRLKPTTYV